MCGTKLAGIGCNGLRACNPVCVSKLNDGVLRL